MGNTDGPCPRVADAQVAKEVAMEAAKSMWRYNIPSSFYEKEYDKKSKCWHVEAHYSEEKLTFKIDATTDYVSTFRIEKISRKNKRRVLRKPNATRTLERRRSRLVISP